MIRRLIRQMLAAQIFSALTVSLCLMIDSIMISRFLGEAAIAAYGLANPLLMSIGAIASILAAGIQVTCSRSLGRGSQEETNAGYSSAIAFAAVTSVGFMSLVLLLRSPLARLCGSGGEGELFELTRDYLAGFSLGAPGCMGALVLVPFLQMAGQSGLLIAAVLTMTVTDVALDLLNVMVFHGGMFGMGLASSISYLAALVIGGMYFISRKSVFRFSRKNVSGRKIAELFGGGIPSGIGMLAPVIAVFAVNRILKQTGGSSAIAAFAVISTIGNASNCITTGIGGVSLTLSGILFNEEDRSGLQEMIRHLIRYGVILGLAVGTVLLIIAPAGVSLFIPPDGKAYETAVLGLRLFALGMIPCCIVGALKNMYLGTERIPLMEGIVLIEGAVLPALAALSFGALWGTTGVWFHFVTAEVLTLAGILLYVRRQTGKAPWQDSAYLLLRRDFGVMPEEMIETNLSSITEVSAAAEKAGEFCRNRGQSEKVSNHMALCIEEMAGNVIQHGFSADKKPHHLSVRLLHKPDRWVLRFRDDCRAFDPVHYVPSEGEDAIGIRLVLAIADEVSYTYSMNLNNLVIRLRGDRSGTENSDGGPQGRFPYPDPESTELKK